MKRTLFLSGMTLSAASLFAQDTTKPREVQVTASFQPVLREAAKIQFTAAPPATDSTRPQLQYNVPNQNLHFAFQPGSLRPLALNVDSLVRWDSWNYIKAGYGTQKTPYIETGLSIGDPSKAGVNLYGNYTSSKGKLPFQEVSAGQIDALGYVRAGSNHEVTGRIGLRDEQFYRYGYAPDTLKFNKDSLSVHYTDFRARIALRNLAPTAFGITYAPELRFDAFSDNRNNSETNTYINLPLRKTIEGRFAVDIGLDGQFTGYRMGAKTESSSNWFQISPSLVAKTSSLYLQAGLRPSWNNGEFKLLPNVLAELGTQDKRIAIIAGWTAHLQTNSFQSLAAYNPWIEAPLLVNNSRVQEIYGGVRGTLADHFSYLVRGGVNHFTNRPLFLNNSADGKTFSVLYEPEMGAINFHGELGYSVADRFTVRSQLDINRYTGMDNDRAWGLPHLEFKTALRLEVLRDLYVKSDIYAFDGTYYRNGIDILKQKGGIDASAGMEFLVYKNVKIWAQFNNVFNQQYQRWRQYPVYGFQFLGGIVFSFPQKTK